MTINLQGLTVSGNLNCQVDLKIISAINKSGSGGNKAVRSSFILNSKMTKVLTVKVFSKLSASGLACPANRRS